MKTRHVVQLCDSRLWDDSMATEINETKYKQQHKTLKDDGIECQLTTEKWQTQALEIRQKLLLSLDF